MIGEAKVQNLTSTINQVGGVEAGRFVVLDTTGENLAKYPAADNPSSVIGVTNNKVENGRQASICVLGDITVIAGVAIAIGDQVYAQGVTGKALTTNGAAPGTYNVKGEALSAAQLDGDQIVVRLTPVCIPVVVS